MTDDRRAEIECRFDGEPDPAGNSEPLEDLLDDSESREYANRLSLLRELARRHDPSAEIPRRIFALPDHRPSRARWWLPIAVCAAAVLLYLLNGSGGKKPTPIVIVERPVKPTAPLVEATTGRPLLEVEIYGWANTPLRAPKQAARLVLSPGSSSRKRSPADEILALEFANASLQARGSVQRFAVSKGSRPSPQPKTTPSTSPRARATFPEV